MVYLIAAAGTVFVVLMVYLGWGLMGVRDALTDPSLSNPGSVDSRIADLADMIGRNASRIQLVEGDLVTLRAEAQAAIATAETRLRAARSAEERTRRMVPETDVDGHAGMDPSQEDFVAAMALSGTNDGAEGPAEPPGSIADLERAVFMRRHGRQSGGGEL